MFALLLLATLPPALEGVRLLASATNLQSFVYATGAAGWQDQDPLVRQFDPQLGDLDTVRLNLDISTDGSVVITNRNQTYETVTVVMRNTFTVRHDSMLVSIVTSNVTTSGISGRSSQNLSFSRRNFSGSKALFRHQIGSFIGLGTNRFHINRDAQPLVITCQDGSCNVTALRFTNDAALSAVFEYDYDPPPLIDHFSVSTNSVTVSWSVESFLLYKYILETSQALPHWKSILTNSRSPRRVELPFENTGTSFFRVRRLYESTP
ncbi:MAG: choice-of-anchor E domain-containing protein [Verrucomicrobiales bacterium]|nr:choice-of-anchor E domain-containing protein [Verrucomicrobiales bacterium]